MINAIIIALLLVMICAIVWHLFRRRKNSCSCGCGSCPNSCKKK